MGISTVDCRVGTIVWVQRKNGSWWPGRIVGPNELSPSHLISSTRTGTPIKLLGRGREDSIVDWYNLEKSKRIKAFRCGEFDDCIERAESSQAYPSVKRLKYANREDAILYALELEKQEMRKKHERPGEDRIGAVFRAKRSRCVYLPTESKKYLERTVLHPQSLQLSPSSVGVNNCSVQSGSAKENTFSGSTAPDSCKSDSCEREIDEAVTQHSDAAILTATAMRNSGSYDGQPGSKNCKDHDELSYLSDFSLEDSKGKLKIRNLNRRRGVVSDRQRSKNGTNGREVPLNSMASSEDHIRTSVRTKSLKNLVSEVNKSSQSTLRGGYLEDKGSQYFGSVYIGNHNRMETTLVDIDLAVQACYQGVHVPLVSLTSRLNGKAIIGHPIDVEASEDGSSEILPTKNDDFVHKLFGNGGTTMLQSVWRTSRRTPVCYVPSPHPSSTFKDDKPLQACQNPGHKSLETGGNCFFPKQLLKNPSLSNRKTRTLLFGGVQKHGLNGSDLKQASQSCTIDGVLKPEESMPTRVTCVPVKLISHKLLIAVGGLKP